MKLKRLVIPLLCFSGIALAAPDCGADRCEFDQQRGASVAYRGEDLTADEAFALQSTQYVETEMSALCMQPQSEQNRFLHAAHALHCDGRDRQ
jgi:hypothetical protein